VAGVQHMPAISRSKSKGGGPRSGSAAAGVQSDDANHEERDCCGDEGLDEG
jgi:hypothetical protein